MRNRKPLDELRASLEQVRVQQEQAKAEQQPKFDHEQFAKEYQQALAATGRDRFNETLLRLQSTGEAGKTS